MSDHWSYERVIFLRSLGCAPELRVRVDSIRRGDEYDVSCVSDTGQELAFELTEVTDQHWAASLASMIDAAALLNERLRTGTDEHTADVRKRYYEHDIVVWLKPNARPRDLRRQLETLFSWLASIAPTDVASVPMPNALRGIIDRVDPRHFPGIKGLCFHVPGCTIWIADRSMATTHAKFDKVYPHGIGLQLLVYFHRQPTLPASVTSIRGYLESAMPHDAFSRVWVYDDQNREVLLRYP